MAKSSKVSPAWMRPRSPVKAPGHPRERRGPQCRHRRTRVLSDQLVIKVTAKPGESFLDRMIAMIEGAARKKRPNEVALTIVLAGFTLVFLLVTVTLSRSRDTST